MERLDRPCTTNPCPHEAIVTEISALRKRSMGETASISSNPSASRMSALVAILLELANRLT